MSNTKTYAEVKISGKQVGLLQARAAQHGLHGEQAILEFLEYDCGIDVLRLEDIRAVQLNFILGRLDRYERPETYNDRTS